MTTQNLVDFFTSSFRITKRQLVIRWLDFELRENDMKWVNNHFILQTNHLNPATKNFVIKNSTLSVLSANKLIAFCNKTVKEYYYQKHEIALKYDFLPCLIVKGKNGHQSYYPLELIDIFQVQKEIRTEIKRKNRKIQNYIKIIIEVENISTII